MSEPVYFVAQIDVKDYEAYLEEYGFPLLEQLNVIGAEVLAADPNFDVLEGDWGGNWMAIIKFPSAAVATKFYASSEYAPLKDLRINKLSNRGAVVQVAGIPTGD
ncbi:MAG: hypothetical protein ACI9NT_001885 [Bacteroidia bacterium]|jgi:uncharacterized protein (DUF1330 family)